MAVIKSHTLPVHHEDSPFLTQEYKDIISYLHQMADGPMPVKWQWEMSNVHLFLISMIERAYLFAPYAVENNDLANFLGYAEISFVQIYSHHAGEEEFIFPTFTKYAKTDIWSSNIEEHHEFDKALDVTWFYIRSCQSKLGAITIKSPVPAPSEELISSIDLSQFPNLEFNKPFNSKDFRRHIDGYILPLLKHLKTEIETLKPENMELVTEKGEKEVRKWLDNHLKSYDPAWFLCSAFASAPIALCKQLIVLPFLVRRILVPFILAPKYKGYWLYAPHPENLIWSGTA